MRRVSVCIDEAINSLLEASKVNHCANDGDTGRRTVDGMLHAAIVVLRSAHGLSAAFDRNWVSDEEWFRFREAHPRPRNLGDTRKLFEKLGPTERERVLLDVNERLLKMPLRLVRFSDLYLRNREWEAHS